MKSLFLIDRGPKIILDVADPNGSALYRRVLWCDSSRVARRLAGDTADGHTVWQNFGVHNKGKGLLLIRWRGLDVDYGVKYRPAVLPDGTPTGFHHRATHPATWALVPRAFWWSSAKPPRWLVKAGVTAPTDSEADRALRLLVADDEASALAKETGNRPFGFRSVAGWADLARSPGGCTALLPGLETAGV